MKQLTEIVRESIFDIDDESITTKRCVISKPLQYKDYNNSCDIIQKEYNISKNEMIQFLTDVRDNDLNVKYRKPSLNKRLNTYLWQIACDNETKVINIYLFASVKYAAELQIVIKIKPNEQYRVRHNPEIVVWDHSYKYIEQTATYLENTFEAMMQTKDKKYDKFKALFK